MAIEEMAKLLNMGKPNRIQFCFHCVNREYGWGCEPGNEEKYLCPIAYNLRGEYKCVINTYPDRREAKKELDRIFREELDKEQKKKLKSIEMRIEKLKQEEEFIKQNILIESLEE